MCRQSLPIQVCLHCEGEDFPLLLVDLVCDLFLQDLTHGLVSLILGIHVLERVDQRVNDMERLAGLVHQTHTLLVNMFPPGGVNEFLPELGVDLQDYESFLHDFPFLCHCCVVKLFKQPSNLLMVFTEHQGDEGGPGLNRQYGIRHRSSSMYGSEDCLARRRPVAEHEEQREEHNEKVCREEQRIPGKVYPLGKKKGTDGFPAFQEGGFDLPAAGHPKPAR